MKKKPTAHKKDRFQLASNTMLMTRLISNDIVTQQRIFGLSVYILITFLLCTIAEQNILTSFPPFMESSRETEYPFFPNSMKRNTVNSNRYVRQTDNIFSYDPKEKNVTSRYSGAASTQGLEDTTATATSSPSRDDIILVKDKRNDATQQRNGFSYYEKYHEVTQLLSSKNITLAHLGIHQQDPIRVFFSEDSMCDDEPPSSNGDVLLKNLSSSSSSPQYDQEPEPQYKTTNTETIAIAIMVPQGQCTLEKKIRNIVRWYQEDHPDVKVVMFYDPILPPSSSDEASMGSASGGPSVTQNGNHGPSFSSDVRDTSGKHFSSDMIDLSSVTSTIVPFHVSQRTAHFVKSILKSTNNFVDVQIEYPYYAGRSTSNTSTKRFLSKKLSFKERILTLISDIFASIMVTLLSLVVTGILLLLCWKDALSIQITRDGVLIISNVTAVGDSHLTEDTEDKRATLSTEHVLALPEVKFGASHPTNKATSRMPSSSHPSCAAAGSAPTISPSTTRKDIPPPQDSDEESCLPLLSTDTNGHFNTEIKLPVDKGLPCFCCNTTCSICLEDFTADESLRLLPCGHAFHTSCILPWLTKRATSCPLCKKCLAHSESES